MSQQESLPQKKPVGQQPICFKRIEWLDPVWCPGPVPLRFWEDEKNRHNYLLWLGHKLRLRRMDHWYSLKAKDINSAVLGYYRCFSEMLRSLYPDYDWQEWLFTNAPHGFWRVPENQRRFMEWVGRKMGVCRWEDWYRVARKDVLRHGGEALLLRYRHSLYRMISAVFPEHDWKPWLFTRVSPGFWKHPENRRHYLCWLGEQLGFEKPEDWYRLTCGDFRQHQGGELLVARYHGSMSAAVTDAFPDYPWDLRRFQRDYGYWMTRANRLRYMRWLGRQLGFRRPADWYRVTGKDFDRHQGFHCLTYYHCCPAMAVMDLYPKHPWKEWLFPRVPTNFWRQPENQRRYMDWLGKRLGFRRPEDWHRVRQQDFANNHGASLLGVYRTLRNLLRELLPDLDWDGQWTERKRRAARIGWSNRK